MKYNHNKQAVYKLMFHIVLCTKYRKKAITPEILLELKDMCNSIFIKNGIDLVEFNGEEDHVHMLIDCHPAVDLRKLINVIKTVSSREIRKRHNFGKLFYKKKVFWSPSYFIASCGGVTIEVLRKYVENQSGACLSPPASQATHGACGRKIRSN